MNNQIVIAIPTYNEIDNSHLICSRVFAAVPEATLWFIDDNSPDPSQPHSDISEIPTTEALCLLALA